MAFTGDNATSNDTQTTSLAGNPNNTFKEPNRVCCFNHILNLAVKSLLKPFGSEKKQQGGDNNDANDSDNDEPDNTDDLDALGISDDCDLPLDIPDFNDQPIVHDHDESGSSDVDECDRLDEGERAEMLKNTEEVQTVISKVCIGRLCIDIADIMFSDLGPFLCCNSFNNDCTPSMV